MSVGFEIYLLVLALASAALGGMLGLGSGLFIVPMLTMFNHVDIHTAIGASLVSVIACSCAGAAPYLEGRLTNVRLAIVLEVATTLGALTGVFVSGFVSARWLFGVFAIVLLVSARQMLVRRRDPVVVKAVGASRLSTALASSYRDRDTGRDVAYGIDRLPVGFVLMYGAGLISALLGIGSGILKIPAMDSALRLPLKVSSATSNFMIGVTASASAGAYFVKGIIVPSVVGPVVIGSVLGGILGARLLIGASNDRIRILFILVLIALSAQMILGAFGIVAAGGGG